jgi:hypothetical protein
MTGDNFSVEQVPKGWLQISPARRMANTFGAYTMKLNVEEAKLILRIDQALPDTF